MIGLWDPSAGLYVGYDFQGARVADGSERYIATAYCWRQDGTTNFVPRMSIDTLRADRLSLKNDLMIDRIALMVAGIYIACTALRLARFNIELNNPEEADHSSFRGLPSPGAIRWFRNHVGRNSPPFTSRLAPVTTEA